MNWIIYFSFGAIVFLSCHSGDYKPNVMDDPSEIIQSKYVRLANDTNHLMLIENVVIRFGDLSAEADSAFYEKPEKRVTLFSVRKLGFKGKELQPALTQKVRYTKGDAELRIN